jgi:hypothetical protein
MSVREVFRDGVEGGKMGGAVVKGSTMNDVQVTV